MTAAIHYNRLDYTLHYWRTNHGAEVDLLVCKGKQVLFAVEIKSSRHIAMESLSGLRSFLQESPHVPAYVLGIDQKRRKPADGVTVIDWRDFILEFLSPFQASCSTLP